MASYKKTVLYSYINSGNHGCEAIARSSYEILGMKECENYILSTDVDLDRQMGLNEKWDLRQVPVIHGFSPVSSIIPRFIRKAGIDSDALWKFQYNRFEDLFDEDTLALSTGGDIYCYKGSDWLTYLNQIALHKGAKTVLWGCSIGSKWMDRKILKDLSTYSLITARESYTQRNLMMNGIRGNVLLYPDPAFILGTEPINVINRKQGERFIGINLSVHVIKDHKIFKVFKDFIQYILDNTDHSVLLIPHVFWSHENDLALLNKMYDSFSDRSRIHLVDKEYNCMQLKYIISQCDLFMGARTHSVIAAYSSFVPALAFSYSVKSRGIAYDLFGKEDGYVLPITDNTTVDELAAAFGFILKGREYIIATLHDKIPQYWEKIKEEKSLVEALFIK